MPRKKQHTAESLTTAALGHFWRQGYNATSMGDLVAATGTSRQGIYSDFSGKRDLFLACFDAYQAQIVSPAFARVERDGASLQDVEAYFLQQIALAEQVGLPGPGCFVANAATENAPHDDAVMAKVNDHNTRLKNGFANALRNSAAETSAPIDQLAAMLVVFTTGLWASSRQTTNAQHLRDAVFCILRLITNRIT